LESDDVFAKRVRRLQAERDREERARKNLAAFVGWTRVPGLTQSKSETHDFQRWLRVKGDDDTEVSLRVDHPRALTAPGGFRMFISEPYVYQPTSKYEAEVRAKLARLGLSVLFWPPVLGFWNPPSCHTTVLWVPGQWTPPAALPEVVS
jgi:hypothetical protein